MQLFRAMTPLLVILALAPAMLHAEGELASQPWNNYLKSHIAPRQPLTNLSQEYAHWHSMVYLPSCYGWPRYHLAINGFYRETTNEKEAGELFGSGKGCNSITIGTKSSVNTITGGTETAQTGSPSLSQPPLIFADRSFMMRRANGPIVEKGGIVFKPQQSIGGVRFDFHYDLCVGEWDKLFFQASTPLVYVENKPGATICDDLKDDCYKTLLKKYFEGHYEEKNEHNLQEPLTKAKIRESNHRFGFADVKISLGYKYYETENSHLFMKINMIVPSGNKENGDYLFDATYGNGGHLGLGWQVDAATSLECNKHITLKFMGAFSHTYLFEAQEMRTPGILTTEGKPVPFGQYYLVGRINQEKAALFPAANVITQKMRIKPGHQFEGLIAGCLQSSNFVIDAGYNMFWRDREDAWIKNWKDDYYALASHSYDTSVPFVDGVFFSKLNRINFDTRTVESPVLFTHTIYGSLGYNLSMCKKRYLLMSVGGSYELSTSSRGFDAYSVWVKTGFSF